MIPIVTVNGAAHWIREVPRNGYFVYRSTPNPEPCARAWWKLIGGPYPTSGAALASLLNPTRQESDR
jgi:septal ring-binding cell division protein DamX